jgi:hypothetical protein
VQDTGYSELFPTGEGVFAFSTGAEAANALAAIEKDYQRHCRAAKELALTYFSPGVVLGDLLERIGL